MIYYTVYRTTCLLNEKYYVGAHKTRDLNDGYLGSGKYLKNAIKKHGVSSFKKEIIATLETEREMYDLERRLVAKCLGDPLSYNLRDGGAGGWTYVNESVNTPEKKRRSSLGRQHSEETKNKISKGNRGLKRSGAFKLKMAEIAREQSFWKKSTFILNHDLQLCIRVAREELPLWLEKGWIKGRKMSYASFTCSGVKEHQAGPKNPAYGKRWMKKGPERDYVPPAEIAKRLADGWQFGRV